MFLVIDGQGERLGEYDTPSFLKASEEASKEFGNLTFDGDVSVAVAEEKEHLQDSPWDSLLDDEPRRNPTEGVLLQHEKRIISPESLLRGARQSLPAKVRRIDAAAVGRIKTNEAFERLRPWLPNGKNYDTWSGMTDEVLAENVKTSKAKGGIECFDNLTKRAYTLPPSYSKGLSFLPYWMLRRAQDQMLEAREAGHEMLTGGREVIGRDGKARVKIKPWEPIGLSGAFNVCVGSTENCRETCLVFTGNNDVGRTHTNRSDGREVLSKISSQNIRKARLLQAFLKEPEAFMVLLKASIEKHVAYCKKHGLQCSVRLNILSDIPWEMIFPEIFSGWSPEEVRFYDYTKLPDREVGTLPLPYDLTFSYAGTPSHDAWMPRMLASGQRIAMVLYFVPDANKRPRYTEKHKVGGKMVPHPKARKPIPWGLREDWQHLTYEANGKRFPVYDGDCHDLRYLDPPYVKLVGLQYKTPMQADVTHLKPGPEAKFLVPVTKVNMLAGEDNLPGLEVYAMAPSPRLLGGFDYMTPEDISDAKEGVA